MTTPRCPICGSTSLWHDNTWEGCNKCKYTHNGVVLVKTHKRCALHKEDLAKGYCNQCAHEELMDNQ